jgi:hypothetical protein
LALWAQKKSSFSIQTIATGARIDFQWGTGTPTDVLVPGDYDGDGIDELAIFNRDNQFWYWRKVSDGAITQIQFGSPTAVPVPADYDGDGRLDPAYWEPVKNAIYVTFTKGKTIDLVIPTPPNSIPIFVTMF